MARNYAAIYLTIWSDPDFRGLPVDAQWLYFTMLTHPTLTACGVMDWREPKLAGLAEDMTVTQIREAAWSLGQKRLIAVDPDTEEGLVRSFVRHDGTLKSPNLTKALVREYGGIASLKLMELVSIETLRAIEENPDLKGAALAEPITKQFLNPSGNPSDLVPSWFHIGSETVPETLPFSSTQKTGNPSNSVSPPHPHPHPLSSDRELPPISPPNEKEKPKRKRATAMPAKWAPTPRHADLVEEICSRCEPGWGISITQEVDSFKAWTAAQGKTYKDWDAAFRNHLLSAGKRPYRLLDPFRRPPAPPGKKQPMCETHYWQALNHSGHCGACRTDHLTEGHAVPQPTCEICKEHS